MQDAATSDFPAMAPADFDPAFQAVAVFVMCAQEEGLADLSLEDLLNLRSVDWEQPRSAPHPAGRRRA